MVPPAAAMPEITTPLAAFALVSFNKKSPDALIAVVLAVIFVTLVAMLVTLVAMFVLLVFAIPEITTPLAELALISVVFAVI